MNWDWDGVGAQAGLTLLQLGLFACSVIALLALLVLALRALQLQHRYRLDEAFPEDDREAIVAAIRAAEARTVGEILPVVLGRSDRHGGAAWLAAACTCLATTLLLVASSPLPSLGLVLGAQAIAAGLGFGLAKALPDFHRRFLSEVLAKSAAEEQAHQEFFRHGLHETTGRTGVLLFVSLLEHRVVVMADEGIDSRVRDGYWDEIDQLILSGVRAGRLGDGLVAGIEACGEKLAAEFPRGEGAESEIPDRVIVRPE